MWEVRDAMARRRDTAPGRVLPDAAIVSAVAAAPRTPADLLALPVFGGRATRRQVDVWFGALSAAAALPEDELPVPVPAGDGPPPANRWAERDPVAARRLARARQVVTGLAEQHTMPPENLVQPEAVRRLAWTPPEPPTPEAVGAALRASGARAWQAALVAGPLAEVLPDPPEPAPEPAPGPSSTPARLVGPRVALVPVPHEVAVAVVSGADCALRWPRTGSAPPPAGRTPTRPTRSVLWPSTAGRATSAPGW